MSPAISHGKPRICTELSKNNWATIPVVTILVQGMKVVHLFKRQTMIMIGRPYFKIICQEVHKYRLKNPLTIEERQGKLSAQQVVALFQTQSIGSSWASCAGGWTSANGKKTMYPRVGAKATTRLGFGALWGPAKGFRALEGRVRNACSWSGLTTSDGPTVRQGRPYKSWTNLGG